MFESDDMGWEQRVEGVPSVRRRALCRLSHQFVDSATDLVAQSTQSDGAQAVFKSVVRNREVRPRSDAGVACGVDATGAQATRGNFCVAMNGISEWA